MMHAPLEAPLQANIVFDPDDGAGLPVREAIVRGLCGGEDAGGGYLAGGADLAVPIRELTAAPPQPPAAFVDAALHTLTVVLAGDRLAEQHEFLDWISALGTRVAESGDRHALLVIYLARPWTEEPWLKERCPGIEWSQALSLWSLGEESARAASAGLIALDVARQVIANSLSESHAGRLSLFLSHAKQDGQPIAPALRDIIGQVPGLKGFYDVREIPPGANWRNALRAGVLSSVLVVLRTEAFERRPWCRQEVAWADEFASPMVVVDLRCRLIHPPGDLGLELAPSARIPDGNFFRIFYLAVRESLRVLMLRRTVERLVEDERIPREIRMLPRAPSMLALTRACTELSAVPPETQKAIVYPDPPLGEGQFEAASALVAAMSPGTSLLTPHSAVASA